CSVVVHAQQTQAYDEMETLWSEAKSLYDKGMYVPAQKLFSQILLHEGEEYSAYKDDAAYYVAICSMNLFNRDAEYQITSFISVNFLGSATPKGIMIELGPVLAALVLAGRVGASISAEMGTMKVTEQIDALESMAINPIRYLAMPRIVATTIVLPVLVVYACTIAIFGSYIVSVYFLGVPSTTFLNGFRENFELKDIAAALTKAVFFGVAISSIGCFYGFKTTEGAHGVGLATIKSFVLSAAMILILDSILWNFLLG
ncbi:MAG TPA: ABC transporter permease, partial [Ignavibacteria bacterium]|nr:ABC transporter permease [Ignavibacteria bacterium]